MSGPSSPLSVLPPDVDMSNWVGPFDSRLGAYATGGIANYAYLNAFTVRRPVLVTKVRFMVVAQNGNIDVGIYTVSGNTGTRLASTGSTAVGAPGFQEIALTAGVLLVPGTVYFAAAAFSGTATLGCAGSATAANVLPSANSRYGAAGDEFPLPTPLTLNAGYGSARNHVIEFYP